jgi:malonate-semialdehyde dehydrogenase (acetylating)/methylmalonate-semialdehyde dehydrogenase
LGEVCSAVPEVYDELIERFVETSKGVTIGDAMDQ